MKSALKTVKRDVKKNNTVASDHPLFNQAVAEFRDEIERLKIQAAEYKAKNWGLE